MRPQLIPFITLVLLTGCATIRDHRDIVQPTGAQLSASVGSVIFRLNKISDLPNAFGGRDIYGGKVDRGFTELKLIGIDQKRFIRLLVFDTNYQSSETTMDRYGSRPKIDMTQSVSIGPSSSEGIPVTIDFSEEKTYSSSGVQVTFLRVRGSSVDYVIQDTSGIQ